MHFNFFKKYPDIFITPKIINKASDNFLAYPIILKNTKLFNRKEIQIYLENNNIQTRPIFSGNILSTRDLVNLFQKNKLNSLKILIL